MEEENMTYEERELLSKMVDKSYVLFAPKDGKDLRHSYPELNDYEELSKLSKQDLLFVWWYACASSPLAKMPDEKRMPAAVKVVYSDRQQEQRLQDYHELRFPSHIASAIKRMKSFNQGIRVQMHETSIHVLGQCRAMLARDVRGRDAEPEVQEQYLKDAAVARKLMRDIQSDIERGSFGVEVVENTELNKLEGLSRQFHMSQS